MTTDTVLERVRAANPVQARPADDEELFRAIVSTPGDPRLAGRRPRRRFGVPRPSKWSRLQIAVVVIVVGLMLAAAATATYVATRDSRPGPVRYSFEATVSGPTHVVRNTQHTYAVALKNYGKKTFRTVKLSVLHWEPISRSSIPYRRETVSVGTAQERAAIWTLHNFRPGGYFRVNITLPFKQHNDPIGSNLIVLVRGLRPSFGRPENQDGTTDITFVRKSDG